MMKTGAGAIAIVCAIAMAACSHGNQTSARVPVAPPPAQASTFEPGMIPAGTTLVIRTTQEINSDHAGQTFAAEVDQDVKDQNGHLLIPKGSPVELAVVQTSEAGMTGTPVVELAMRTVSVASKTYPIATGTAADQGAQGLTSTSRTADRSESGALLGTLISARVDGTAADTEQTNQSGKSSGPAAAQVFTRGKRVEVPAQSVLTFRLDQPWVLRGYSS